MTDGACNWFYGGPAMKQHTDRLKWNLKHILDFKHYNPHTKELRTKKVGIVSIEVGPKAYQDLWTSLKNVHVSYARLCPRRAGTVNFWTNIILVKSIVGTVVLAILLII